jgi:energy-coupling factor transporter ATP-binding protein EcfA2
LIVGRTGSGKTALIKQIKNASSDVSVLDPEELSMQYLHNSVLRTIASWGVNLDIFYKYLWRHVCILELIRMRYGDAEDVPSRIQQIFPIAQIFKRDHVRSPKTICGSTVRITGSEPTRG